MKNLLIISIIAIAGSMLAGDQLGWAGMDTGVKFARQNPHPIESPAARPNPSPAAQPTFLSDWLRKVLGL
jgi:hypothetical protein